MLILDWILVKNVEKLKNSILLPAGNITKERVKQKQEKKFPKSKLSISPFSCALIGKNE